MKIGTEVKYKRKYTKWLSEYADTLYNYPDGIKAVKLVANNPYLNSLDMSLQEHLRCYFMDRYSYDRNKEVHGVIVGDNGYIDEKFAYIVWSANELGEDICYVGPESLERL